VRTLHSRPEAVGSRAARTLGVAAAALVALAATSCGGGDSVPARQMALIEFLFVDRALNPTQPTGTQNLPRNAQILMIFSEEVNPATVDTQTIQIRFGPQFQSVPVGSFSVDGNSVRFDPTVTAQGEPNPFGLQAETQYSVGVPNFEEQPRVVENRNHDPLLTTFFTSFKTSDDYLRELVPPEVLRVFFVPDPDALTGQVPGNGSMAFEFSEPMDPSVFVSPCSDDPTNPPCIQVRFDADAQINRDNGLVNTAVSPNVGHLIPGHFTRNAAATIYFFHPTFSFGDRKYVFNATLSQCLTDLSGNLLINPRTFGDFTSDGLGRRTGRILGESFDNTTDMDPSGDADWGVTEDGVLQGLPLTTRQVYVFSYPQVQGNNTHGGQYAALADPLIGAALNNQVPVINPPTSMGRRVMWAFSDAEIGPDGSITDAAWGPDSNATFAAFYPNVILRCGYQVANQMSLSPSFSGNYEGQPTVVYQGTYTVSQKQNVGNVVTVAPVNGYPFVGPPNGFCTATWNDPLFNSTGFYAWPTFTNVFEWDDGEGGVANDRVLLFDASVKEGDRWQQIRAWFAVTFPCSGVPIPGYEHRRLYATYEEDDANPTNNPGGGIYNPEPSISDTAFTVTKIVSIAQSRWYTDGTQPTNSTQTTFGDASNYLVPMLDPPVQEGGATIVVQFQGADAVEADRRTINQAAPFLPTFVDDVDDCDGYRNVRWRIQLRSNLNSGAVGRLHCVQLPVLDDFQ
jgi:hypothetical protein